jgi:dipeptidyl aminopeptidase/acylaminoacyl peptidase
VQVTQLPLDVGSFRLSPRGDRILISAEVFADCDPACTAARLKKQASHVASGVLQQRLFVRHWDAWSDERRSQLFSIPLDAKGAASGAAVLLTQGLDGDVPHKPFGGREDYAFSPDGATVVFSLRVAGDGEPWSTNFDLYAVPATGGQPRNLTAANPASDTHPVFSPDGSTLAYLAMERPGYEADRQRLMLLEWKTGASRPLTQTWDRSVEDFGWSRDGRSLFGTAQHLGQKPLWLIDAASGRASAITGAGTVEEFSVGSDRLVYSAGDLATPQDLYSVAFTGGRATQLTRINGDLRATRRLGEFEQFSFNGARNDLVYAYLVKPAGFKPGVQYPVAVLIHGGPQGSMANEWHWRWNAQNFAGAGYAALLIDFHGSTGYGQAFTDSINQDWGGKPFEDIQKGVTAALAKYKFLDPQRMCALGGSYGGYMVNWIAGAAPDRFRCLVNHAGVFDNRAMYYSTEELWFPEWEFGGPEFANPQGFAKHNPVDHVKDWKTPMLVIHGQKDYRVPYTQGLSAFTALQRRGIPSQWLMFPDENHWILKPANSMQWYEVVIDWMNRWTSKPAGKTK